MRSPGWVPGAASARVGERAAGPRPAPPQKRTETAADQELALDVPEELTGQAPLSQRVSEMEAVKATARRRLQTHIHLPLPRDPLRRSSGRRQCSVSRSHMVSQRCACTRHWKTHAVAQNLGELLDERIAANEGGRPGCQLPVASETKFYCSRYSFDIYVDPENR